MIAGHPEIRPAFATRNIPVVFATDANYLPYLAVAINSLVANTTSGNLDVLVLHAGIEEETRAEFLKGFAGRQCLSLRFVDVMSRAAGSALVGFMQGRYHTVAACYRLFIPEILPDYDRVIYLDVDTIVCHDIGELLSVDISGNLFAAALDIVNSSGNPEYRQWGRSYGFEEWSEYVNSGVVLFNLQEFRKANLLETLLKIAVEASKKWFCDQDALNFVCKGRIARLDPRWNVQVGAYCLKEQLAITKGEAFVIHYTDSQKPWCCPAHPYAHLWWRHVDASAFPCLWRRALGNVLVPSVGGSPKVSVIMAVYNAAKYLPQALASVLCQKDIPDLELICVDDASTDDSAAILEVWHNCDHRLQVLRQANQGPGVARNVGMDVAKGEYICFLDADDRIASGDALLRAYEQAKRDGLDVLLAASSTIAEDGQVLQADASLNHELVPQESVFAPDALGATLFLCTPMGPWGKFYRRAFLEENKLRFPALKRSEGFPMVELALSLSSRIGVFAQSVYERRIGVASSLESTKDETPLIFFEAERLLRDSLRKRNLWSRFKAAVYSAFVFRLAHNLQAVRRYSSFRAIIDKYRQEQQQWICWEHVALPERFAGNLQLVKDIMEGLDDDDQIALFVQLREAAARNAPEIKMMRIDLKKQAAKLKAAHEAIDRRNTWVSEARGAVARRDEKVAALEAKLKAAQEAVDRRNTWVSEARGAVARRDERVAALEAKLKAAQEAIDRRNTWVSEARGAVARRDEWLNAEKSKVDSYSRDLKREKQVNAQMAARVTYLESILRQISTFSN